MREWYDRQAAERKKEAGKVHGRGKEKVVETFPQPISDEPTKARDQVGKLVGVSGKTIDAATKVLVNAIPEVVKAVEEGRMSVHKAAAVATESKAEQVEAATKPKGSRKTVPVKRSKGIAAPKLCLAALESGCESVTRPWAGKARPSDCVIRAADGPQPKHCRRVVRRLAAVESSTSNSYGPDPCPERSRPRPRRKPRCWRRSPIRN